MWPRAEAHGNRKREHVHEHDDRASMWPRAEAHGNKMLREMPSHPAMLQCGRGPKPTEICICLPARPPGCGFNVAAGRSPRKSYGTIQYDSVGAASMWPRAEAHGNAKNTKPEAMDESRLQCGRGPKPTEIILYLVVWQTMSKSFNVAAGRSPRKCSIMRLLSLKLISFNVAAGRSPRKYQSRLPFNPSVPCFNVAAGRSPRK